MASPEPVRLLAVPITRDHPAFATLLSTSFADPFVSRLLRTDLPLRMTFGNGRVWVYTDPTFPGVGGFIGFGSLDVCDDYGALTGDRVHPYLPLLSLMPGCSGRGYGEAIMRHLEAEAALVVRSHPNCDDRLFLDVYLTSAAAIRLYEKRQFEYLNRDTPSPDTVADGAPYYVMAKRVSVGTN
jgi:ribosomal protein S18 acetylase RimI-like enzyme